MIEFLIELIGGLFELFLELVIDLLPGRKRKKKK